MYIECQECIHRQEDKCEINGKYAEPNHIYANEHCTNYLDEVNTNLGGNCGYVIYE